MEQKKRRTLRSEPDENAATANEFNVQWRSGPDVKEDAWPTVGVDKDDMDRLGKAQEFKRNFGFWSALGFIMVFMGTWEFVLITLAVGFTNGGFAGQYHWVSEFAPPRYQKVLSYVAGWNLTLGWLATNASGTVVVVNQIQAMITIQSPEYAFKSWQSTLIMIAFIAITILFNTWGASTLPTLQVVSLCAHLAGFLVVMIPLLVLCPKNDAYDVFLDFQDNSGWDNMGAAFLICQVYVLYCCLGSDAVCHISEEVRDASLVVPQVMVWAFVGNIMLGLGMLVTMLFCIGPLEGALDTDAPYLLLFNKTGSPALSTVLNVLLFLMIYVGNITVLAACSREVFAFARDKGLPFSSFQSKMDRKRKIPTNAIYVSSFASVVLVLINLGSPLAFNIIISVAILGVQSTYLISIGCVLLKRLNGEPLPPARWSLGRYGIVINAYAFLYSAFAIVICCFPTTLPVTMENMNWAPVVWVGVLVGSYVFYVFWGKRFCTAPVQFVEGRKAEGTALQTS
ncbi:unnamed protein product [Zymoseptoria tritici ST99CH_3D1]|nr:unnamed protein product [Zymoseptoria tritici ST99CH_3D1]